MGELEFTDFSGSQSICLRWSSTLNALILIRPQLMLNTLLICVVYNMVLLKEFFVLVWFFFTLVD